MQNGNILRQRSVSIELLYPCRRGRPNESSYTIDDNLIPTNTTHRDLGVIASADLSWSHHYKNLASHAYKTLGLLRRSFRSTDCINAKKSLYLSLVRSQLLYCSQVWRPYLIKDIVLLEKIQRRATKYILKDFVSDYKSRLIALDMLPLMVELEINDIMFFIRSLKLPGEHFNILSKVSFCYNATRSGSHLRLSHTRSTNSYANYSFFNRLPRLWNSLPPLNLDDSARVIKRKLQSAFKRNFDSNFNPTVPCTFHFVCPCHRCSCSPNIASFNLSFYLHVRLLGVLPR